MNSNAKVVSNESEGTLSATESVPIVPASSENIALPDNPIAPIASHTDFRLPYNGRFINYIDNLSVVYDTNPTRALELANHPLTTNTGHQITTQEILRWTDGNFSNYPTFCTATTYNTTYPVTVSGVGPVHHNYAGNVAFFGYDNSNLFDMGGFDHMNTFSRMLSPVQCTTSFATTVCGLPTKNSYPTIVSALASMTSHPTSVSSVCTNASYDTHVSSMLQENTVPTVSVATSNMYTYPTVVSRFPDTMSNKSECAYQTAVQSHGNVLPFTETGDTTPLNVCTGTFADQMSANPTHQPGRGRRGRGRGGKSPHGSGRKGRKPCNKRKMDGDHDKKGGKRGKSKVSFLYKPSDIVFTHSRGRQCVKSDLMCAHNFVSLQEKTSRPVDDDNSARLLEDMATNIPMNTSTPAMTTMTTLPINNQLPTIATFTTAMPHVRTSDHFFREWNRDKCPSLSKYLRDLCKPLTVDTKLATDFSKNYDLKLNQLQKDAEESKSCLLQIATPICTGIVTPNTQVLQNNLMPWPQVGALPQQLMGVAPAVTLPYAHAVPYGNGRQPANMLPQNFQQVPAGIAPPVPGGPPQHPLNRPHPNIPHAAGNYVSNTTVGGHFNAMHQHMNFGHGLMRVPVTLYQPVWQFPTQHVPGHMMMNSRHLSPPQVIMTNRIGGNVVANESHYTDRHQYTWQQQNLDFRQDTGPHMPHMYNANASEMQLNQTPTFVENKENNNPVPSVPQQEQVGDATNSYLAIPTSVDGQNDRDLSPIMTSDVFDEVCKLPTATETKL